MEKVKYKEYKEHKEHKEYEEKVAIKEELTKYFHKKMCYCIEAREAICWKLKCCDIYQYVPYKVFIKLCKYGECKYVEKPSKETVVIPEKHAGVSA